MKLYTYMLKLWSGEDLDAVLPQGLEDLLKSEGCSFFLETGHKEIEINILNRPLRADVIERIDVLPKLLHCRNSYEHFKLDSINNILDQETITNYESLAKEYS